MKSVVCLLAAVCLLTLAGPAVAHVMSMSQGDLVIEGDHARYELHMPLYEVAHVSAPEKTLLEHIRFEGAQLTHSECRAEAARDTYVCIADYHFAKPHESVDVECTFPEITVPNHVHLLRATLREKRDEAIFDRTFSHATLRFRPPTSSEIAITQGGAGALRALGSAAQALLLVALVLAARSRRELLAIGGAFFAGEIVSVLVMSRYLWQPPARFVEAATALAVAYLAVEILFLPQAGARWLVTAALGALHGLYFHSFLQTTEYSAALVLAGAVLVQVLALGVLAFAFSRIQRMTVSLRPLQFAASMLLGFGMIWFLLRMRS